MRIALCDDDPLIGTALRTLVDEYVFTCDTDITVDYYASAAGLLEKEKYDLYFLDYLMPEMNGDELALRLKEKFNNAVTVCFLTSYEKAAVEIINKKIGTEAFLVKPVEKEKLFGLLDRLCGNKLFDRFVLKQGRFSKVICAQEILYAEASRKETVLHFYDGTESFLYTFSDMEEHYLLPPLFCRIHRSYIVNLMHVSAFSKAEIVMTNGDRLPLKREREFRTAFSSFRLSFVR